MICGRDFRSSVPVEPRCGRCSKQLANSWQQFGQDKVKPLFKRSATEANAKGKRQQQQKKKKANRAAGQCQVWTAVTAGEKAKDEQQQQEEGEEQEE